MQASNLRRALTDVNRGWMRCTVPGPQEAEALHEVLRKAVP